MMQPQSAVIADGQREKNKKRPPGVKRPYFWIKVRSDMQVEPKKTGSSQNMARQDLHLDGLRS